MLYTDLLCLVRPGRRREDVLVDGHGLRDGERPHEGRQVGRRVHLLAHAAQTLVAPAALARLEVIMNI